MERSRFWLLSGVALLMALAGTVRAEADVGWTHDFHIAPNAWGTTLIAKIHAETLGEVDIAWKDIDTFARYSQISKGSLAVNGEIARNSDTHDIMGIGRHSGSVRVGLNAHLGTYDNAMEYTRTGENSWVGSDTDHRIDGYATPSGGYDVDPATGLGGFIYKDPCLDIVYVFETAEDVWEQVVLETLVTTNAWGRDHDLVYTSSGDPIGAYKYRYTDPNGDPYFTCCNELRAGKIEGLGPLNYVYEAFGDQFLDVTVVPDGNVYLLDYYNGAESLLHLSEDGGQTWATLGAFPADGGGDNNTDVALAVAPDESVAAVLHWGPSPDPKTALWISEPNLATGQPLGAEWHTDPCWLPGAGDLKKPDVAFDPYGYLYVIYYRHDLADPCNAGVHLLTNMPPWADSDLDGVHDEVDLCPDSDPNEYAIDFDGCKVPPACDDPWHPIPAGDRNGDCYVNTPDLIPMAQQWLDCVHPLDQNCMQLHPSPEEMYPDLMYMPHCWDGSRTVDGQLGDWPDPCWIALDQIYWTLDMSWPNDLPSAQYTVCWDPCDDLFYAAVQVVDTDHVFETAPTDWHTSDRVEIYVQADPNGGDNWGSIGNENYDKAQQYIIGYQGLLNWAWAVFGHGTYLPGDFEPENAHFADAGTKSGDTITYEVSAKAWQWYGGITPAVDPNVVRQLEPGIQVGFDVVADSRWGTAPHDDNEEFGMLSANLDGQKFIYAERFQRWELLDFDGTVVPPECGDWGNLELDTDGDCYIGLSDFAAWSVYWLDCTHPDPPCSYKP